MASEIQPDPASSIPESEEQAPVAKPPRGGLALPMFVLSLAILAQEILLTRLLAVGLWHHITYMVVTSALLAFGSAGTLLAIFPGLAGKSDHSVRNRFALYSVLFAVTSFVSTHAMARADIDTSEIFTSRTTFGDLFSGVINELFLLYVLVGLPIFFGGLAVVSALRSAGKRVPRLYFANLLGSAGGCGLFLVALAPLGGPRTMLLTVLLGAIATMLTPAPNRVLRLILPGIVAVITLAGMVSSEVRDLLVPPLTPVASKTINEDLKRGRTIEKTLWNTLCRLDVITSNTTIGSEEFGRKIVHQDGDAPTFLEAPNHPPSIETNVPYIVHPGLKSICIIGSGGSRELRLAQNQGIERAVGVEINSATVSLVKEHYADYVGDVSQPHVAYAKKAMKPLVDAYTGSPEEETGKEAYAKFMDGLRAIDRTSNSVAAAPGLLDQLAMDLAAAPQVRGLLSANREAFIEGLKGLPDIELVNAEGRAYLARTKEKFDYIQMTGVDTYAALNSGAYVNSESYLYTSDAFDSYLERLNPNGYFSIIRYSFPVPRETMRLFIMASGALKRLGIKDPTRHLLVVTVGQWGILVVGKEPIPEGRVQVIRQVVTQSVQHSTSDRPPKMEYDPYEPVEGSPYTEAIEAWRGGKAEAFIGKYPYNIAPISDDAPFFYLYHRWNKIRKQLQGVADDSAPAKGEDNPGMANMGAVPTGLMVLLSLVIQSFAFGLLFVLVPIIVFQRRALKLPGRARSTVYFACLGLAFMLLEISIAQKFSLFLGHPTLSLGVVLAGMLFFSGLGSLTSGLFSARKVMPFALVMVVVSAIALVFVLPMITETWLQADDRTRILFALAVIGPLGFFMGMPMPSGLRILSERGNDLVAWAWGVNGVASVLGSILAVVLAMSIGFQAVMITAAAIYGIAWLARLR